jgi:hypothetical protein
MTEGAAPTLGFTHSTSSLCGYVNVGSGDAGARSPGPEWRKADGVQRIAALVERGEVVGRDSGLTN